MSMLLSKLIENCKDEIVVHNFKDIIINGIDRDSRLIKNNYVFFAIKSQNIDGNSFIKSAIENGAKVIVTESNYKNDNIIIINSNNIMNTFGKMLNSFYYPIPENIIGITGTSGKTSTAEYIRQTIQELGYNSASVGSLGFVYKNSYIKEDTLTMKETVDMYSKLNFLKTKENINYVAMEYTSQGLHQNRATGLKVDVAVFTNITPEHLDYHKDMSDYLNQKLLLFTNVLKDNGTAILNADIPEFNKIKDVCLNHNKKIISYGYNGDIKILDIHTELKGQKVLFQYLNKEYTFYTNVIGKFQIMNLLACLGAIISLNLESNIEKIVNIFNTIKNAKGRMEFVAEKANGATIYIDYAHKPDALKKVLETMRDHIKNIKDARLCILFGCGGDRDKTKRPIMGKIANDLADVVFVTDDNPRTENAETIRNEIMSSCPKAYNIGNREIAIKKAIDMLEPKDILILAGKGHEDYTIIGRNKIHFDEFEIVKNYLKIKK